MKQLISQWHSSKQRLTEHAYRLITSTLLLPLAMLFEKQDSEQWIAEKIPALKGILFQGNVHREQKPQQNAWLRRSVLCRCLEDDCLRAQPHFHLPCYFPPRKHHCLLLNQMSIGFSGRNQWCKSKTTGIHVFQGGTSKPRVLSDSNWQFNSGCFTLLDPTNEAEEPRHIQFKTMVTLTIFSC